MRSLSAGARCDGRTLFVTRTPFYRGTLFGSSYAGVMGNGRASDRAETHDEWAAKIAALGESGRTASRSGKAPITVARIMDAAAPFEQLQ